MLEADTSSLSLPPCHPRTWTSHYNVEIHAKDTNARIVSRTQIDVLLNTETEVTSFREVAAAELILLDLQPTLQNFLSLGATDGDVNGDFFVTADTERAHGVACFGGDGGLTGKLFEDL